MYLSYRIYKFWSCFTLKSNKKLVHFRETWEGLSIFLRHSPQIGFFDQYFWCQIQPTHNFHRQSLSVRPYYHLLIVDRSSKKILYLHQSIEVQIEMFTHLISQKSNANTYVVCIQRNWLKHWLKKFWKTSQFLTWNKRYWNFIFT